MHFFPNPQFEPSFPQLEFACLDEPEFVFPALSLSIYSTQAEHMPAANVTIFPQLQQVE